MAIEYLDGGRITGLSTDAKPDRDTSDATIPALTVQAGSVFIETDTGARYVHNGTAWIQQPFDSINSAFGKSGGVTQRQHFVEWFTGKSLNTDIWGYGGSSSGTANSVAMADSVNGGVELTAGNSGYNYVWLTTGISGTNDNDNRPHAALDYMRFDPDGCSIVCVMKFASALSTTDECGFSFSTEGSGYTNRANQVSLRVAASAANYTLRSHTSGGVNTPSSDVAVDTAFHTFKLDLRPTFSQLTIDGVLAVGADSTYKPTIPLEPNFSCASTNNNTATINVTYIEAYNT